ncbi:hypothetical protein K7432_002600 [Basidiobolus ranarum]|uniref:AB hydrolase-1 domain-containing protein n=1 Tax=Basidiobolus ranarum TaxID=34480 RepID=A0ABR2W8D8_9FUNG
MSIFVLIHGAEMGLWAWEKLVPYLESLGHQVVTFDLPGSYEHVCEAKNVTLASYVSFTVQAIQDLGKPVFLVGHSFAGMVISQVGELIPDRIQALIYLTAFLPMDGQSGSDLVQRDAAGELKDAIVIVDEDRCQTKPEAIKDIFLNDCTPETVQWGISRCRPQIYKVMRETVKLSDEKFGKLKKVYISCLKDRAISPALQKLMYTSTPCDEVLTLDAGHVPSLSIPSELANLLGTIANKYEP